MSNPHYIDLVAQKRVAFAPRGFEPRSLHPALKPHQEHCVDFAVRQGSAALFLDTGLGKTLCALDWGRQVVERTNRPVLMLAPLAVAAQHEREAGKFGIDARKVREAAEISGARIYVTNYDRLDRFDADDFAGVILDESSIIKSFSGQTSKALIQSFARTPYRLACTATPAPNDHMELGQHSEFLGVMRQTMMLNRWFIHDSADTGTWRMKGHAVEDFWSRVASWARCISKPSDIGLSDDGYDLPPLDLVKHEIAADRSIDTGAEKDGQARLFRIPETSATSIHKEKRLTVEARADVIARLVAAEPGEPWIVWCETDYEADALMARLSGAVEVRGSMKADDKEERLAAFADGRVRVLVSKPSVCGWGLNWQHCARVAFIGLSFSYEAFYQAVRRCWRFGQTRPVKVHVAMADTERAIWEVVSRKAGDHDAMKEQMTLAMRRAANLVAHGDYQPRQPIRWPSFLGAA